MKNNHMASTLLTVAGTLLTLSGILMAACDKLAFGGLLWAAASGMFFSAFRFRQAEIQKKESEESDDAEKTI